jgi:hypothetical protein
MRTHTLNSIAQERDVNKRAAQSWLARAKAKHGELGEIIGTTRHFSDEERDILLGYAGEPRRKAETSRTPEVLSDDYPDPFSDMTNRFPSDSDLTAPGHFQGADRSVVVANIQQRVQAICSTSAANSRQSIEEMIANGNQTGQALGAVLAESIIKSAEQEKNALLSQYMQSQGITTTPKRQTEAQAVGAT